MLGFKNQTVESTSCLCSECSFTYRKVQTNKAAGAENWTLPAVYYNVNLGDFSRERERKKKRKEMHALQQDPVEILPPLAR